MLMSLTDMLYKRPRLTKTLAKYFAGKLTIKPSKCEEETGVKHIKMDLVLQEQSVVGGSIQ